MHQQNEKFIKLTQLMTSRMQLIFQLVFCLSFHSLGNHFQLLSDDMAKVHRDMKFMRIFLGKCRCTSPPHIYLCNHFAMCNFMSFTDVNYWSKAIILVHATLSIYIQLLNVCVCTQECTKEKKIIRDAKGN